MRSIYLISTVLFFLSCESAQIERPMDIYTIKKGHHYANQKPGLLQTNQLKFEALFDASAQYELYPKKQQQDINKLMGFADCNVHHHEQSARYGWRWFEGKLEIFAYCYINGERLIVRMGNVSLHERHHYQIDLTEDFYVFQIDNRKRVFIKKGSNCEVGGYLMLYPYFGGDLPAPQEINVRIKLNY